MAFTKTFAIDNSQRYEVVVESYCRKVELFENYDSDTPPTTDLIQYEPAGAIQGIAIPQGTFAVFDKGGTYSPGEIAGEIQTDAGSITVAQKESG